MLVLVHLSPTTLEGHRHPNLGVLSSPRRYYTNVDGWQWAADNDAFLAWDESRYLTMLDGIAGIPGCLFVTVPDVVGDWKDTIDLYELWADELVDRGLPVGYVLQDGQPDRWMPWGGIDAVFVGGTDAFKMGEEARELVYEAQRRGIWTHMGRVNGLRRVRYARAIGCDSIDGSSLSSHRDEKLDAFVALAAHPEMQLILRAGE